MLTIIVKIVAAIALAILVKEIGNTFDRIGTEMTRENNYGVN